MATSTTSSDGIEFGMYTVLNRRGEEMAQLELPLNYDERRKAFAMWVQECEEIEWADALAVADRMRFFRC